MVVGIVARNEQSFAAERVFVLGEFYGLSAMSELKSKQQSEREGNTRLSCFVA